MNTYMSHPPMSTKKNKQHQQTIHKRYLPHPSGIRRTLAFVSLFFTLLFLLYAHSRYPVGHQHGHRIRGMETSEEEKVTRHEKRVTSKVKKRGTAKYCN